MDPSEQELVRVYSIVYDYASGWADKPTPKPEAPRKLEPFGSKVTVYFKDYGEDETGYTFPESWLSLSSDELREKLEAAKAAHEKIVSEALRLWGSIEPTRNKIKFLETECDRLSFVAGWVTRFSNAETQAVARAQLAESFAEEQRLKHELEELMSQFRPLWLCCRQQTIFEVPSQLTSITTLRALVQ